MCVTVFLKLESSCLLLKWFGRNLLNPFGWSGCQNNYLPQLIWADTPISCDENSQSDLDTVEKIYVANEEHPNELEKGQSSSQTSKYVLLKPEENLTEKQKPN